MKSIMVSRGARAISAVILILTAAGCASGHGAHQATSPAPTGSAFASPHIVGTGDVPQLLDTSTLKLPLDAYLPTLNEVDLASKAHRELIRRCMKRFGIDIVIPEAPPSAGPKSRNERRYGLTSSTAAATIGYGLAETPSGTRSSDGRPQSDLTAKGLAVLTGEGAQMPSGVPSGGCRAEAGRRLATVDVTSRKQLDEDLPQRLSLDSFERSQDDPRVKAAFADWSTCMKDKGHAYKVPLDPFGDPKFQPPGGEPERKTAQDDVACKASTNLVGRWFAVESALQVAQITKHKTELIKLAKAQQAVRELVQTLV